MDRIDLEPAANQVRRLLDGITDGDLDRPTPSTDTSVATLLDHLMGLTLAFTWAARKTPTPGGPPSADASALDPRWREELPVRLSALVAAWREPAAWTGDATAGGVTMPAPQMAAVALDELVMHGWDLAKATGQPFDVDPASAAVVLAFTAESARPEHAGMRDGLFGPVVPVPDDAPDFDRALGYAGRDPNWTRPQ
jgi:uncharacterized protein (TIGR03086 family)